MLEHINGIRWIGDLSIHDADVLAFYGKNANRVFEHGSGGSTMILAQTAKSVLSLETNLKWLVTVQARIDNLGLSNVNIVSSIRGQDLGKDNKADLFFIDGEASKRYSVIKKIWPYLSEGGYLLVHDTREFSPSSRSVFSRQINDVPGLMYKVANDFRGEVESLHFNVPSSEGVKSNISVIKKVKQPYYESWQDKENRPQWSYGSDISVTDKFLLGIQEE